MFDSSPLDLLQCFRFVTDRRINRKKLHRLDELLVVAVCGVLAGVDNWVELERFANARLEWFREFLTLENGIPSHDTFGRVFSLLEPEVVQRAFSFWVQSLQRLDDGEIIAIDGKTSRGSASPSADKTGLHTISAWATQAGLVLAQASVDKKANEIVAIPPLLHRLRLSGCIVTIDATGCQKKIASTIVDRGGDYVTSANEMRLYFSAFAHLLVVLLRHRGLAHTPMARATAGTIRARLLKAGAILRTSVRRIHVALSAAFPAAPLFRLALAALRGPP